MLKAPAHVIVSLVFFIGIGMGFAYSYFFYPDDHPVDCMVKQITGKDCPSCGFTRSFSLYTRAQFTTGRVLNPLSWKVFLFFAFQFILRFAVVTHYLTVRKNLSNKVVIADAIISILLFLLAFLPVIKQL